MPLKMMCLIYILHIKNVLVFKIKIIKKKISILNIKILRYQILSVNLIEKKKLLM